MRGSVLTRGLVLAVAVLLPPVGGVTAQTERSGDPGSAPEASDTLRTTSPVFRLNAINVTATRSPLEIFGTSAPVTVLGADRLASRAHRGPLDPLRLLPGLDVEGVGATRVQPVIRGFTGQRVLLLADGLRLANSRRRLASVEPASLSGVETVRRVEVVRGPASVLYGSDAIGGVVNLVTRGREPPRGPGGSVHLTGSTVGDRAGGTLEFRAPLGPIVVDLSAGYRDVASYRAPSGRFGDVRLPDGALVHDSGVRDRHLRLGLESGVGMDDRVFLRAERYDARESGFGFVDPTLLGNDPTTVRLTFPDHDYTRLTAGWEGRDLPLAVADAVDVTLYLQDNDRDFVTRVRAPLGPPGAELRVRTDNRTELATRGGRLEARAALADRHALTYGVEAYKERSRGSDTTTTTIVGFGPEQTSVRGGSRVPDARLTSVGVFAQDRWRVDDATELTLGARYQSVSADPDDPGDGSAQLSEHSDRTLVGSASVLRKVGSRFALVASVARGFRSPNLVERFFSGPTPGGQGVWVRNPDLEAETSLTADLGVRLRGRALEGELFVFRTRLSDGVRLEPTGREVDGSPEFRNENVDALVVRGLEAWTRWSLTARTDLTAALDVQDRRNPDDPDDPLVEGVRTRLTGSLRQEFMGGRLNVEWRSRWHSAHRETLGDASPVGSEVPAYAVHDLHADLRLTDDIDLTVGVENLLDRLYALDGNVGFFRPEPGRGFVMRVRSRF